MIERTGIEVKLRRADVGQELLTGVHRCQRRAAIYHVLLFHG